MCCLIDRVHKNNRVKDQIALNSFVKDVALTSFVKASNNMSKFVMNIVDNVIAISLNLPQEECSIINNELKKEVESWQRLTLEHTEETLHSGYKRNAPKHSVLVSKKKKETSSEKEIDVKTILLEMKKKFIPTIPKVEKYIPEPPDRKKIKHFEELKPHLTSYNSNLKEVDNCFLMNVYLYGRWLILAYEVYRYEKLICRNKELPSKFEQWIERNCDISRTSSYNYRNFAKLIQKSPKLVYCRVGMKYFIKHHDILLTYFTNNDSPWRHKLACSCDICLKYFK